MRSLRDAMLLLCLAALAAAADFETPPAPTTQRSSGPSGTDRSSISRRKDRLQPQAEIVGGRFAKTRAFPYQVYVRIFHKETALEPAATSYCGGAIIGKRHILTAAHCVKKDTVSRVEIIAGVENRWDRAAVKFKVISKSLYQKKDGEEVDGDIAVLLVDRPMPLNLLGIKLLELAKGKTPADSVCLVAGWGDSKDDEDEDLLKYVALKVSSDTMCQRANPTDATGDLLCAGVMGGGKDTCQGDSGSPLVCGKEIAGVVKGGRGCGLPGYPGTYTAVSYYRSWVRSVMTRDESVLAFNGRRKWNTRTQKQLPLSSPTSRRSQFPRPARRARPSFGFTRFA